MQREKGERPLTMIRTVKRSDGDEDVSYSHSFIIFIHTGLFKDELDIDVGQGSHRSDLDEWEIMSVQSKPLHRFVGFDA